MDILIMKHILRKKFVITTRGSDNEILCGHLSSAFPASLYIALKSKIHINVLKTVYLSQKNHCVFITKLNWFMLSREPFAFYSDNYLKYINTMWKYAEFIF
jgi:hypothetical protein